MARPMSIQPPAAEGGASTSDNPSELSNATTPSAEATLPQAAASANGLPSAAPSAQTPAAVPGADEPRPKATTLPEAGATTPPGPGPGTSGNTEHPASASASEIPGAGPASELPASASELPGAGPASKLPAAGGQLPGAGAGEASPPIIRYLPLDAIRPNRSQPRQQFDEPRLQSLADSIRQDGVMQPIVVRPTPPGITPAPGSAPAPAPGTSTPESNPSAPTPTHASPASLGGVTPGNPATPGIPATSTPATPTSETTSGGYELIAGERRWRAARLAGLAVIPAIIHTIDDLQAAEWALIENLQREDLNPIERARAFQSLGDHFNLTHQAIGDRVGLDRSSVGNLLRLLTLAPSIQSLVADTLLSMGHARAIAAVPDHATQLTLAKRAIREGLSVRQLEQLARRLTPPASDNGDGNGNGSSGNDRGGRVNHLADLERQISEQLGTRVSVTTGRKKGAGKMTIEFYTLDQFDQLLDRLGVTTD